MREKNEAIGNAAAMRAALDAARDLILPQCNGGTAFARACGEVANKIMAALSEPPRNCDVGTPEEQDERWQDFCIEHHEPWKAPSCRVDTMNKCKTDCPCLVGNSCNQFVWAQMPYEEGGVK